jgi:aldehyde dehydrogenase (NAD+)
MKNYEKFYINGEWVNPVNTLKTLDVINPATEESIGTIAMGDRDDVDAAVKAAENAFVTFSQTSVEERVALLQKNCRNLYESFCRNS